MTLRAALVFLAALAFAAGPLLVPDFGGFEPDRYPVPQVDPPVQPAGYAFSIWGPIYLWLLAMAGYGLLRRREDPDWDATRLPLIVSLVVGATWLAVALASPVWATILIWVMLAGALWAYLATPDREAIWLRAPVGLYAGWLTAASAVSVGLLAPGWGVPPFGQTGWAVAALSGALLIAAFVLWRRPGWAYGAAVTWALVAVVVRNGAAPVGLLAGLGALAIAALTVRRMTGRRPA